MLKTETASGVIVELFVSKTDAPHTLELTYENKIADAVLRPLIKKLKTANVFIIDTLSDTNSQWHITKNELYNLGELAELVCVILKTAKIPFKAIITYATTNYSLRQSEVEHISSATIQAVINKSVPLDTQKPSDTNWNANMLQWLE